MSTDYLDWRAKLAKVIDPRFYSLDWLDAQIMTGAARAWANDKAIIVATLKVYPAGAVEVHGVVAAGDLDAISALIPLAEQWGRENNAIVAGVASRPGWARELKNDGYQVWQVELRKELN